MAYGIPLRTEFHGPDGWFKLDLTQKHYKPWQAAQILGISEYQLTKYRKEGAIKVVKFRKNMLRYSEIELMTFKILLEEEEARHQ